VHLILACIDSDSDIKHFMFTSQVYANEIDYYRLVFIVTIALLRKFLMHAKIKYTAL